MNKIQKVLTRTALDFVKQDLLKKIEAKRKGLSAGDEGVFLDLFNSGVLINLNRATSKTLDVAGRIVELLHKQALKMY